jgi:hypothetical protein
MDTPAAPKYPHITVPLTGADGNAFNLLGLVLRALRRAGVPKEAQEAFRAEATRGDYHHLLQVIMTTVHCE